MAYEVQVRHVDKKPTAVVRARVPAAEIGPHVQRAIGEVYAYLQRAGAGEGPPFGRFELMDGEIQMEVGAPTNRFVAGEGRVSAGELPGGDVAVTKHVGPYDTVAAAYEALRVWIAANGRQEAGGPWEVWMTDPQEVPDPAKWETEVIWPIR